MEGRELSGSEESACQALSHHTLPRCLATSRKVSRSLSLPSGGMGSEGSLGSGSSPGHCLLPKGF